MKINIVKIDDTKVAVDNTATLVFKVNEYPNYTLLHSQVSNGEIVRTVENENAITIRVEGLTDAEVTGTVYIYYTSEVIDQSYIEFTDENECLAMIKINDFNLGLIDRVSSYGQVLTYKVIFKDVEETFEITTILLPEDAYLLEPDKTVCVKYNPEVSSLKRNFVDVITPTLGSETPFIRRAGKQKYKTFTLGGLISIEAEAEEGAPINGYSLLTSDDKELLEKIDNMQLSTYDARAVKERLYRERILDFLEDGKVKLFKSVQEGNIWVYLSGVTLTADKPSARNLYSFSCTATEVAPDYAGYYPYLIMPLEEG